MSLKPAGQNPIGLKSAQSIAIFELVKEKKGQRDAQNVMGRMRKVRARVRFNHRKIQKISRTATLGGLFLSFLKIGLIGFGGGLAVIAQIRTLSVTEREWLSEQEFAEALALAQSLPGTNAGNAATYVGLKLCGWRGAATAMFGFILPSTLLMIALAVLYSEFRSLPNTEPLFHGLNSAVVALILVTAWRLMRTTLSKRWQWLVAAAALFSVVFFEASVIEVVLGAGLVGVYFFAFGEQQIERLNVAGKEILARRRQRVRARVAVRRREKRRAGQNQHDFVGGYLTRALADERVSRMQQRLAADENSSTETDDSIHENQRTPSNRLYSLSVLALLPLLLANFSLLLTLAIVFLRIGAVTFGGGFVMIPLIESEVVENHHWLSHQEFADATALGQITPGPVLVTATFIGYRVAGIFGALIATISVFLPAFLLTIVAGNSLRRFRSNKIIQSFLLGVTPAVVGLMIAAAVSVGRAGIHTWVGALIAGLAIFVLLRFRPNPFWVLLGAGAIRFLIGLFLW